ncbi:MAG TPA: hypothetical protein GXZ87_08385 [Bacteroidales bacterium]|nr:hypothetical protein [Bacteroidales bacterium]
MSRYDRSIKIVYDNTTRKILEADEIFDNKKDGHKIRLQYHNKEIDFSCYECGQDLIISKSKYDKLYFKHKPGHDDCILSNSSISLQEQEQIAKIIISKESDRHKELKNKIGEQLKSVKDVDVDSIAIDDKFIIKENGKRRPDVYCKFQDKEIVFEIQLSNLSLNYILSRYNFYKKHQIYLIWILDNFDIHNQGTLEKDIKYLTKYENFFKLDEQSATFKLVCDFKHPYLTDNNQLFTKWVRKSVSLNDLTFDNEDFQAYYYNYDDNKTQAEKQQKKKLEELKLRNAKNRVDLFKKTIAEHRRIKSINFSSINLELENMDEFEIKVLNEHLGLQKTVNKGKAPLIIWIDTAKQDDVPFLEFIIEADKIAFDRNKPDEYGKTALQALLNNKNIFSQRPIKSLFKAGYKLTNNDYEFLLSQKDIEETSVHTYILCNRLSDRSLVDDVFKLKMVLFIIESAIQGKIIGFNFTGNKWISFANNAIEHYSNYWRYLELVFKRTGLWNKLIESDRKGTFQNKLRELYSDMPPQNHDFDNVFYDLYPEYKYVY